MSREKDFPDKAISYMLCWGKLTKGTVKTATGFAKVNRKVGIGK